MALSGPVIVVSDEATQVHDALAAGGNLPVREVSAVDAVALIAETEPSAVVLADRADDPDFHQAQAIADAVDRCGGSIIPIMAIVHDSPVYPLALPVQAQDIATRLVGRLRSALRVRALHASVQRRIEQLGEHDTIPESAEYDPIEDATVLVAGRGRGYPALTVAVGERMGLIGALSLETARSYLAARDIDGVIIGEGFNRSVAEDFVAEIGADPRWRDLAVIAPLPLVCEVEAECLPNLEQMSAPPAQVAAHMLPFARLHAFGARLKRMAASLDQKGLLDPNSGLTCPTAFMRELARAVTDADVQGGGLCLARFTLDAATGQRASLDAARIAGRLVRASDLACRDEDGSILIAFTETELAIAHVVARRIASVLKHTTVAGGERTGLSPSVSLVARQRGDTAESLVTRTSASRLVAAE